MLLSLTVLAVIAIPSHAADQSGWLNSLMPLPQEVRIDGAITVKLSAITVRIPENAGEVERFAASELASFLGVEIVTRPVKGKTELLVGTFDSNGSVGGVALKSDVERLRTLPNSDQSYVIRTEGAQRIVLAGLTGRGVTYAVRTFIQCIGMRISGGAVTIPKITVTDWPDLAYRGFWDDTFPADQIDWVASMKLNVLDCLAKLIVNDDGRGQVVRLPSKGETAFDGVDYAEYCRLRAVQFVPVIMHLSHLSRTGIYEKYPQLIGIGEPPDKRFIPPCAKRPELANVLADWMEDLAKRPAVEEISVWLSEVEQQCQCPECLAVGQYVMETRAILNAYNRVKANHPGLGLRILTTQGSYASNEKILAEIPEGVGVVYYDGVRTYDSSREPMIYFPLREFAAKGGILGVCPQLTVSWAVVCPWSSPQFVRCRMNEFADKKLTLVSAYATPDLHLYEFNVAAAAEWSWNAHGRTEGEFALAWATCQGMKDPETFADWAVLNGSVSWDIYGSAIPYHFIPNFGVGDRMIKHHVKPVLGEDMFRYFPTPESFDEALAKCSKALAMARKIGDPRFIEETLTVRGYIVMTKELYFIALGLSEGAPYDNAARKDLDSHLAKLTDACRETNESLTRWEALFGDNLGGGRFKGTIELSDTMAALVRDTIAEAYAEKK